jgi:hypothetical protein
MSGPIVEMFWGAYNAACAVHYPKNLPATFYEAPSKVRKTIDRLSKRLKKTRKGK